MSDSEQIMSCRLNSSCECIGVLISMVEVVGRRAGLSDKQINRMKLAVDEMFANIARHAYHGHEGAVEMSASWRKKQLRFELRDYADPLSASDIRSWARPAAAGDELKPGGLGMQLMRAVMDRVEHEALADGNRWLLIKDLGVSAPNEEHSYEA